MQTVTLGTSSPQTQSAQLGRGNTAFIVSITGSNGSEIASRARAIEATQASVLEWRIDALDSWDTAVVQGNLRILRRETTLPILATYRSIDEGGAGKRSESQRIAHSLLEAGIDALDIEASDPNAEALVKLAYEKGTVPVLSMHDFQATPGVPKLLEVLEDMQQNLIAWFEEVLADAGDQKEAMRERGVGIVKVACMPKVPMDALKVAVAARRFADSAQRVPFIALSMGPLGEITRAFAGALGSAATFASLSGESSAPGQIDIDALEAFFKASHAGEIPQIRRAE